MPKSGDRIGPYSLVSKLGRGAFGVVWLAEKRMANDGFVHEALARAFEAQGKSKVAHEAKDKAHQLTLKGAS